MKARLLLAASGAVLLGGLGIAGGLAQVASAQVASAQGTQGTPDPEQGRAVYEHWCAPCHAAGPGHPGTQSLQIKYDGNLPAVLEEREDLTPEVVKVFVRQGILSMAPFRKTEITDAELEGLAAYLSN
jgi:(+)-pinoresinol hydroxylase